MNKSTEGFSLIELLLALTLSTILMLSFSYAISTALALWQTHSRDSARLMDAAFVLNQISREVWQARAISSASSANRLILDSVTDSLFYDFYQGMVRRSKDGKAASPLTDKNRILGLSFNYPSSKRVWITVQILTGQPPRAFLITAEAGVRL
jgi:prepilin-type N-terminal cleavage/methylation domain-containing protein